jgi:hypothetical protein
MSLILRSCRVVPMLLILLAIPAMANLPNRPHSGGYDKTHEITVQGTIQKVISSPAGVGHESLSLMVVSGQSTREVALGSFLTKDVEALLVAQKPIQLIGAMQTIKGRPTLIVREFIINGRTVEVRNEHGFFLRPGQKFFQPQHAAKAQAQGNVQQGDK